MSLNDSWPADPKLPLTRRYEVSDHGNQDWSELALENVVRTITAAHALRLPFSVTTERSKQFRHGGNVVKADIVSYVVTVGKSEKKTS